MYSTYVCMYGNGTLKDPLHSLEWSGEAHAWPITHLLVTVVRVLYQLYFDPIEAQVTPQVQAPSRSRAVSPPVGPSRRRAIRHQNNEVGGWMEGWGGWGRGGLLGRLLVDQCGPLKRRARSPPPPSPPPPLLSLPSLLSPSLSPAVEVFELKSRIQAERAPVINGRRSARRRRKKGKVVRDIEMLTFEPTISLCFCPCQVEPIQRLSGGSG